MRTFHSMKHSVFILICILLTAAFYACSMIGGSFSHRPSELDKDISSGARKLIEKAYSGLSGTLVDYHTHIVGLGAGGTGTFVNEEMQSLLHPIKYMKFSVYRSAAAIRTKENADREYILRLVDLIKYLKSKTKFRIMAFDKHYREDGSVNLEKTEFYVPNEYVMELSEEFPEYFEPTISVHPYRKDALQELEKWAKQGVKHLKWLPNAMGMNPAHPKTKPFYEIMHRYGMVLISHSGEEQAVEADEDQKLGNPLLLRAPLDAGVKVVVAHCASLGEDEDLDHPQRKWVSSFKLFLRLMENKKYNGKVFGEISAMTQFNRLPVPMVTLLKRTDLHHRLVNGSDYPLPAVNVVIRTSKVENAGLITEEEAELISEIYEYNPLMFDYVLKRTLRLNGKGFPAQVFQKNPNLP